MTNPKNALKEVGTLRGVDATAAVAERMKVRPLAVLEEEGEIVGLAKEKREDGSVGKEGSWHALAAPGGGGGGAGAGGGGGDRAYRFCPPYRW